MSMDLLKEIAACRLPAVYRAPADIDRIRILRQAGLVIAWVPGNEPSGPSDLGGAAQVLALTEKGREELLRSNYPCKSFSHASHGKGMGRTFRTAMDRARKMLM